jgi:hypothetical protein
LGEAKASLPRAKMLNLMAMMAGYYHLRIWGLDVQLLYGKIR